jgi:hypothetical protein
MRSARVVSRVIRTMLGRLESAAGSVGVVARLLLPTRSMTAMPENLCLDAICTRILHDPAHRLFVPKLEPSVYLLYERIGIRFSS